MEGFYKEFIDTQLYKHLKEVANEAQVKMVNDCINYCHPLLAYYTQAFPSYTLHNNTHQKNILKLISDLLGERVAELTALETTLIILSTFFHDIGMVFNKEELECISEEETFKDFLQEKYDARLIFEQNDSKLTEALAEWYCRWMHAKRVWIFLDQYELENTSLEWEGISIKEKLGYICESHNDNAASLVDGKYETDFLGENDLRFCAALLRLADILDFDNSRTPKSVYEFLGLDKAESTLGKASKIEWDKHLASKGFSIKHTEAGIILKFTAGPKHPQVEKNIETFLNIIEDELQRCKPIIEACSAKWRDTKINPVIDRKEIRAQGYKKGNYQLSLDEKQIITLLTGENLYSSPFEFIRELLQNAIDTSRMREFHEHSNGNSKFKADPIQITSWVDAEGYRWFRVDDYGMGMNETVITNHLLRKGNSYYKSGYFQLQNIYYEKQTGKTFTPISRFGIGLLSCFILGDKVEINTRSIKSEQSSNKEEKIRLSIDGLQNQYILQTEEDKHTPPPFPENVLKPYEKYRTEIGSSIAVRINRTKDHLHFSNEIERALIQFVTCSPIPIYYNSKRVGVDFTILNQPFAKNKFYRFTKKQKKKIENLFEKKVNDDCGIEIITIDLTKESATSNLRGQLTFARLILDLPEDAGFSFDENLSEGENVHLSLMKIYNEKGETFYNTIHLDLSFALEEAFNNSETFLLYNQNGRSKWYINSKINLIHNGINVPNRANFYTTDTNIQFSDGVFDKVRDSKSGYFCMGIIYLQDELIPDLSVSRNTIKNIGFPIFSALYYATRQLNIYSNGTFFKYLDLNREEFNFKTIANDYLIKNGYWDSINIFLKEKIPKSIVSLKAELENEGKITMSLHDRGTFLSQLIKALLEINFEVSYDFSDVKKPKFCLGKKILEHKINEEHTSLLFIPFIGINIISFNGHINTNHLLTKWLIINQQQLKNEFSQYYFSLINSIKTMRYKEVNKILNFLKKSISFSNVPVDISSNDYLERYRMDIQF